MPACTAVIRPVGAAESYLGQPCTLSLINIPSLLWPLHADYPDLLVPVDDCWELRVRASLLYLYRPEDPWLHIRVPLRAMAEGVHTSEARWECPCHEQVPLGLARMVLRWTSPTELNRVTLSLTRLTMDTIESRLLNPALLWTALLPGTWPAAIEPAYDSHRFTIWVRLH